MDKDLKSKIALLAEYVQESHKTMVLTGAGISTDSGIPDFRSKGTGLWEKTDPMQFLTRKVLLENPAKFYAHVYRNPRPKQEDLPRPNCGHKILATLEQKGLIAGIITQNVDRLHYAAGSKKVYEVHGNIIDGFCTNCGRYISNTGIRAKVESGQIPPRCDYCNGVVRSSIILFGDPLPEAYQQAKKEASASDLMIVIGSSLAVSPANYLALRPKKLIIINRKKTKMDKEADLILRGGASEILEKLLQALD